MQEGIGSSFSDVFLRLNVMQGSHSKAMNQGQGKWEIWGQWYSRGKELSKGINCFFGSPSAYLQPHCSVLTICNLCEYSKMELELYFCPKGTCQRASLT